MGFLLGAFGKLAAGRRVRDLQSRMMRVQSRLRRATRECADMDKLLQRQEKMDLNALKAQAMSMKGTSLKGFDGYSDLTSGKLSGDELTNAQAKYNEFAAGVNAQYASYISMMQQQIADKYEYLRETQYQPLKDEEENLQTENDTLQSQLQIAQADYEACKKMEQADAKNLAPNYTGQG